MDEQKPQIDVPTPGDSTPAVADSAAEASSTTEDTAKARVAEDSRDSDLKKAQADAPQSPAASQASPSSQLTWGRELKRFDSVVNEVLTTKEALRLTAFDRRIPPEFLRDWTFDSNRFFILAVNIRRRQKGLELTHKAPPQKAA